MTMPKWQWLARERAAFIAVLAETADPIAAAKSIGRTTEQAYRNRDTVPVFAGQWTRAIAAAWDRVETRLLAGLLVQANSAAPPGSIDSRMVLALLKRRDAVRPLRRGAPPPDAEKVSQLRAEIRALAGPQAATLPN